MKRGPAAVWLPWHFPDRWALGHLLKADEEHGDVRAAEGRAGHQRAGPAVCARCRLIEARAVVTAAPAPIGSPSSRFGANLASRPGCPRRSWPGRPPPAGPRRRGRRRSSTRSRRHRVAARTAAAPSAPRARCRGRRGPTGPHPARRRLCRSPAPARSRACRGRPPGRAVREPGRPRPPPAGSRRQARARRAPR